MKIPGLEDIVHLEMNRHGLDFNSLKKFCKPVDKIHSLQI